MDTAEFINRAKAIHGNYYDYSDTRYVRSNQKVTIICPVHGPFEQVPSSHLQGKRCKKCSDAENGRNRAKKAGDEFVKRAREVHGERYDYSKVRYRKSGVLVEVICPDHGPFTARPNHLRGVGCPKCGTEAMANKQRTTMSEFIKRANETHENRYDYSKVRYERTHDQVDIICAKHGVFSQTPANHLRGNGCRKCASEENAQNLAMPMDEFLNRAQEIHGNEYSYDKMKYKSSTDKIVIICPVHGAFEQTPSKHLMGQGCPSCANRDMDLSRFVQRAREVHGDRYDYSVSVYCGARKKIEITCPEHGRFEQTVHHHLNEIGCPLCVDTFNSNGVKKIDAWLVEKNISFQREMTFDDLRSEKNETYRLRCDFFLPEHDIIIEFDGQQHFSPKSLWGGEEAFRVLKANDQKKNKWAEEKGYKMVRIRFDQIDGIDKILSKHIVK